VSPAALKAAGYVGGIFGAALLVALLVRADLAAILHAVSLAGWSILWLLPYRLSFYLVYGLAWQALLRPYDLHRQVSLAYLTWGASVREGIDRLLPVASVGGAVVGVRLLGWRGIPPGAAGATVVVEVLCTLIAVWAFCLVGLALLAVVGVRSHPTSVVVFLVAGMVLPVLLGFALRHGSIFARLEAFLGGLVGVRSLSGVALSLDAEVHATLGRTARLAASAALQLCALASGAFEVWFSLRLFGHPVHFQAALIMESLTQAARHLAFLVPGALGVQEFSLIFVGATLGIDADLALAVSLIKRARELVWGIAALGSWQWEEGRRLRGAPRQPS
jgi:putative membrane protein